LTKTFAAVEAKKSSAEWLKQELDTLVASLNTNLESVKGQVDVVDGFKEKLMDLELSIKQQAQKIQNENDDASKM
jgi:hypothetical protein